MPRRKKKTSAPALVLPILPVRNTVLFPHVVTPLFVDRDRSLRAIEESMGGERTLVVIAQRDPEIERPGADDLYLIGTEAVVGRVLKMPDGSTSALVQGQRRVKVTGFAADEPYLRLTVEPIDDPDYEGADVEALVGAVTSMYEKVVKLSRTIPDDHYVAASTSTILAGSPTSWYRTWSCRCPSARTSWKRSIRSSGCTSRACSWQGAGCSGASEQDPLPGSARGRQEPARVLPARAASGDSEGAWRVRRPGARDG